jgi:hypothetical protein
MKPALLLHLVLRKRKLPSPLAAVLHSYAKMHSPSKSKGMEHFIQSNAICASIMRRRKWRYSFLLKDIYTNLIETECFMKMCTSSIAGSGNPDGTALIIHH